MTHDKRDRGGRSTAAAHWAVGALDQGRAGRRGRVAARSAGASALVGLALLVPGITGPVAAQVSAGPPAIVLSPSRGTAGTTVQVSGTGFCPTPGCPPVEVRYYGFLVASGIAVSNSGTFVASFVVDSGGPIGNKTVIASQARPNDSPLEALAEFDEAVRPGGPRDSIPPGSVPPGSSEPTLTATSTSAATSTTVTGSSRGRRRSSRTSPISRTQAASGGAIVLIAAAGYPVSRALASRRRPPGARS